MAMRLVLNAVLLYVILQFFIQDAEGQILRKSSLDDCISNMIQADSSKGMPNKLSEVLEQWQPSLTGIISHWLWQQIPTQENELCARCRDNKCFDGLDHNDLKEHFKDIAKEVYGRGVVQNLIINTLILGGKFSLSAGSGGVKVGSDLIQLVLEYFSFPLATYTGKAVGLIGSTGAGAWGGYTNWGDDGVVGGALLGLLPWIYCEVRLESSATLFFDEAYLKTNLKEAVTAKFNTIKESQGDAQGFGPILSYAVIGAFLFCMLVSCICAPNDAPDEEPTLFSCVFLSMIIFSVYFALF